jgi:hypothetical protein
MFFSDDTVLGWAGLPLFWRTWLSVSSMPIFIVPGYYVVCPWIVDGRDCFQIWRVAVNICRQEVVLQL